MGHIRLGSIPKSRPWTAVAASLTRTIQSRAGRRELVESSEGAAEALAGYVARKTLVAARAGLTKAKKDDGLRHTFYLLTQVALASRDEGWLERLHSLGIRLSSESTIIDLTTEFQAAIDRFVRSRKTGSDISEMAQRAAGDALTALVEPKAQTLFGNTGEDLRQAIRSLSTRSGFGELGQAFFGRLMSKFLNFYLSRLTASQLGAGPLQQVGDISSFNAALATHCLETALIVRDFSGQWYSKTEYQQGISPSNAGAFVAVALEKLATELKRQETGQ
jgi:hypothetical protein